MKLSTTSSDPRAGLPGVSGPDDSPTVAAGREILRLVEEQVALGPRVPGTGPHDQLGRILEEKVREYASEAGVQEFTVTFRESVLRCANLIGIFRARAGLPGGGPAILIGTHYDTRIRADRDADPARRECPIPGANDGGSGTAVLLHLLPWLAETGLAPRRGGCVLRRGGPWQYRRKGLFPGCGVVRLASPGRLHAHGNGGAGHGRRTGHGPRRRCVLAGASAQPEADAGNIQDRARTQDGVRSPGTSPSA